MTRAKPPMPGIYSDIPAEKYHSWDAISSTLLGKMHRSPAHAKWFLEHGFPETPAMKAGTAAHAALLEPKLFAEKYVQLPDDIDLRTKAGKEQVAAIEADGRIALKDGEYKMCDYIARAVERDKRLQRLFGGPGDNELSIVWRDPEYKVLCKARIDRFTGSGYMVDLKTCLCAQADAFARSVAKYGYHRQAAWYLDGTEACGLLTKEHVIVAVEKPPPHIVEPHILSDDAIEAGRRDCRDALTRLLSCQLTDDWPGYSTETKRLDLPEWAMGSDDDDDE